MVEVLAALLWCLMLSAMAVCIWWVLCMEESSDLSGVAKSNSCHKFFSSLVESDWETYRVGPPMEAEEEGLICDITWENQS